MNGRDEAAGGETENDAGGEVVFADAMAQLEILVEHGTEREGDGLWDCLVRLESRWSWLF